MQRTITLIHSHVMIEAKNLTFSYSRKKAPVLNDFSITIDRGKISGLLGKNGTGKSTLLYLIAGLLTPQDGEVLFDGINTRRRLPQTLQEIFIVPEEFDLPAIPLLEFIETNAPLYPKFSIDDMTRYLHLFDMTLELNLGALSMGERKKCIWHLLLPPTPHFYSWTNPPMGLISLAKVNFANSLLPE